MDYNKLYTNTQDMVNLLEEEDVGVTFGSSEYKKAKKDCTTVSEFWTGLKDRGKDFQMSDHELEQARQKTETALDSIKTYLGKKKKEKDKNGRESDTSHYRVEAMRDAQRNLQEQLKELDDLAAQRGMERPLPSDEQLEKQRKDLATDLEEATRNVHNGSKEFQNAKEQYEKLNDLWTKTMQNKGEDELPTAGEIENLRATIENARKAADAYLIKKADMEDPGAKTEKRITAMSRVKDNLEIQEKKLAQWQKQLAEKEPVKGYLELANDTQYLNNQMEAADQGVVGGSKEFKEVESLLKKQQEKWREFEKKGPDYKMSPEELREMVDLNQRMEKAVDKYIADKAGKDLSAKTQKRLRVMQKVKNHVLSQQKKFEARRDEMLKEVEGISNQEVEKRNLEGSREIRNANKNVYFGSRAFSDAMKSYNRSLGEWRNYQAKEASGKATTADRQAEMARLQANVKQIDKYLDTKKNKDLSKNPKTARRVEAMEKARKNLQIRMRKIELAEKKRLEAERNARKKTTDARKNNLRLGMKSQLALDRNMSGASLAATAQLEQLGRRRTLSPMDQRNARMAVAALVLEERLRRPGNEALRGRLAGSGKEYARQVKNLADSKEFKKSFPDKAFTPANCANLANDPRVVQRCAREFENRLVAAQRAKQMVQSQKLQRQNVRTK
jgi:hypothetical protein